MYRLLLLLDVCVWVVESVYGLKSMIHDRRLLFDIWSTLSLKQFFAIQLCSFCEWLCLITTIYSWWILIWNGCSVCYVRYCRSLLPLRLFSMLFSPSLPLTLSLPLPRCSGFAACSLETFFSAINTPQPPSHRTTEFSNFNNMHSILLPFERQQNIQTAKDQRAFHTFDISISSHNERREE